MRTCFALLVLLLTLACGGAHAWEDQAPAPFACSIETSGTMRVAVTVRYVGEGASWQRENNPLPINVSAYDAQRGEPIPSIHPDHGRLFASMSPKAHYSMGSRLKTRLWAANASARDSALKAVGARIESMPLQSDLEPDEELTPDGEFIAFSLRPELELLLDRYRGGGDREVFAVDLREYFAFPSDCERVILVALYPYDNRDTFQDSLWPFLMEPRIVASDPLIVDLVQP